MVRRKYVHASADSLNHEEIDPVLQFTEIKLRYLFAEWNIRGLMRHINIVLYCFSKILFIYNIK